MFISDVNRIRVLPSVSRGHVCVIDPLLSCLPASERLMGADGSRVSIAGGCSVSWWPGLRQRPSLHAQPGAPRKPLPVPLAQPRLLNGPRLQQPTLHPALPGRRPLPPLNHQQLLPVARHLLPLPSIHEQLRQRPGVQDGDRGGGRRPRQPHLQHRGSLLGQRGRRELLVTVRDQEGLLTGGGTWGSDGGGFTDNLPSELSKHSTVKSLSQTAVRWFVERTMHLHKEDSILYMLVGVREQAYVDQGVHITAWSGGKFLHVFSLFLLCGSFVFILMAKSDQCGHITRLKAEDFNNVLKLIK